MRIAIIGANGQLGTELRGVFPHALPLTHADFDITSAQQVDERLGAAKPEIVLNTAAYNLVDQAEDDPESAYQLNALGPRILAKWCHTQGCLLVHFSTDYVFGVDRNRTCPYAEIDLPGPLGVYGATKLAGEHFVEAECQRHLIVRTCGLYGRAENRAKGNFVATMLRLARERDQLRVVDDQVCTPSLTCDVARMTQKLVEANQTGRFHVTNSGQTTWCQLAREVFRLLGVEMPVVPIASSEYPTKARRPAYSVLDCTQAETATGWKMPPWEDALRRHLESGTGAGTGTAL